MGRSSWVVPSPDILPIMFASCLLVFLTSVAQPEEKKKTDLLSLCKGLCDLKPKLGISILQRTKMYSRGGEAG